MITAQQTFKKIHELTVNPGYLQFPNWKTSEFDDNADLTLNARLAAISTLENQNFKISLYEVEKFENPSDFMDSAIEFMSKQKDNIFLKNCTYNFLAPYIWESLGDKASNFNILIGIDFEQAVWWSDKTRLYGPGWSFDLTDNQYVYGHFNCPYHQKMLIVQVSKVENAPKLL